MPNSPNVDMREQIISVLKKDRGFYKGMEQVYMPLVDDLVKAFAQYLESIELPEKKRASGDLDSDYTQGRHSGYNEALIESQAIINQHIERLRSHE